LKLNNGRLEHCPRLNFALKQPWIMPSNTKHYGVKQQKFRIPFFASVCRRALLHARAARVEGGAAARGVWHGSLPYPALAPADEVFPATAQAMPARGAR
jgi:hypothetical protein